MPGAVESFVETDRSYLSNESGSARDDGCTAVTAVLLGQKLIIANVGDSRAVLSRAGHGTLFAVLAAWPGSPGPGLAAVLGSMRSGTGSVTTVRGREAASSALVRRLLDRVSSEARSSGEGPSMGSDRQGGTRSAEAHAQPCHRKRRAVSGGFMGGGAGASHPTQVHLAAQSHVQVKPLCAIMPRKQDRDRGAAAVLLQHPSLSSMRRLPLLPDACGQSLPPSRHLLRCWARHA